jgi:hypothetical protein
VSGKDGVSEAVADRVALLIVNLVDKCAKDRDVYTLDELLKEMSEKLVAEAEKIKDTRVLLTTAELIGCMKQEYFQSRDIGAMLGSLMEFYLSEIKKRFDGDSSKKN